MAGMQVRATSNSGDVLRGIERFGLDLLKRASTLAVNELADRVESTGVKAMTAIYKIPNQTFRKYISIDHAGSGESKASIEALGSNLPLYLFNPRVVRGKGGGVRVTVKGKTFLIRHAFLAKMRSGHVGIFARGAYGGKGKQTFTGEAFGRFQFGRKRYSINELFTFSVPRAFLHPDVVEAMDKRIEDDGEKVFRNQLRFVTR